MDTSGFIRELEPEERQKPNEIEITQKQKRCLNGKTPKKRKNWMRNRP